MPDGYGVDAESLTGAAGEILECLSPVDGLHLENVSGSGEWYGHDELYQAIGEFGVVWQLAATMLGSRSMSAAGMLGATAESYVQAEESSQQQIAGAALL